MSLAPLEVIDDATRAASILNPARLRLLNELAEPDSAAGLARRLNEPRQAITYHVRQLEAEGLVTFVEERKKRNCVERVVQATARAYVISPAALGALGADPSLLADRFSSAYLLAVASRIIRDVSDLRRAADAADRQLATLTIQADVRFATPADQHQFATELANAFAGLVARYHDDGATGGRTFSFTVAGHPAVGAPSTAIPVEEARIHD